MTKLLKIIFKKIKNISIIGINMSESKSKVYGIIIHSLV